MKSRTEYRKHYSRLSLSLMALSFVACQGGTGSSFDDTNSGLTANSGPVPSTPDAPTPEDPTDFLAVNFVPNTYSGKSAPGVKNFEQAFQSMRQVTGLANMPLTQQPLSTIYGNVNTANTYLNLKSGLPSSNAINGFLPTHMLNLTSLATTFCNSILNNAAARGNLLSGSGFVDGSLNLISGKPSVVFKNINANGMVNDVALAAFLAAKFWGPLADADADRAHSEGQLVSLIDNLIVDPTPVSPTNPAPTVMSVILGACSAALSSGQVVLF